jgi:hypothetical protein
MLSKYIVTVVCFGHNLMTFFPHHGSSTRVTESCQHYGTYGIYFIAKGTQTQPMKSYIWFFKRITNLHVFAYADVE